MNKIEGDVLIIGAGAAGMSAALTLAGAGKKVILCERDALLGGILNQCIHNGFGLHYFKEELTGPEFAGRLTERVAEEPLITVFTSITVTGLTGGGGGVSAEGYGKSQGVCGFTAKAAVLAMGSRERNRGSIPIPGTRPAGVFTAGTAQRLINIEGIIPGRRIVIAGSGDIGLIMARRLVWSGLEVLGVVEIQPYPAGLTRNIVQCLNDFSIPLYLSHEISAIYGRDRVCGVEIKPVSKFGGGSEKPFFLSCDTLLLSVGLIPENELSKKAGIGLDSVTGGPKVDSRFMTDVQGIFSCGNVLHIHDLVDYCSMEAEECARGVLRYLENSGAGDKINERTDDQINVKPGPNIRYAVPQSISRGKDATVSFRSLIVENDCRLSVKSGGKVLLEKKLRHVQPSEMVRLSIAGDLTADCKVDDELEVILS